MIRPIFMALAFILVGVQPAIVAWISGVEIARGNGMALAYVLGLVLGACGAAAVPEAMNHLARQRHRNEALRRLLRKERDHAEG